METCANCEVVFEKRIDGKCFNRFPVTAKLNRSSDVTVSQAIAKCFSVEITPKPKGQAPCVCPPPPTPVTNFWGKIYSFHDSKDELITRMSKSAYLKRKLTPSKTPVQNKRTRINSCTKGTNEQTPRSQRVTRRVVVTPGKIHGAISKSGKVKTNVEHRPVTKPMQRSLDLITAFKYRKGVNLLFSSTKGAKKALMKYVQSQLFKEVSSLMKIEDFPLREKATLDNMRRFAWANVIRLVQRECPLLTASLAGLFAKHLPLKRYSLLKITIVILSRINFK